MTHNQGHDESTYPQHDPFRTEGMQVNIDDLERELFSGSTLSEIGYDSPMDNNRLRLRRIVFKPCMTYPIYAGGSCPAPTSPYKAGYIDEQRRIIAVARLHGAVSSPPGRLP